MKLLSGYLDDAYMTWLRSSANCCVPLREQVPMRGVEKPMRIEHHQPRLIPPPIPESQEWPPTRRSEWMGRTRSFASRASSRGSFSVRRKLNAYNGPRRPRISEPSDFRHVDNSLSRKAEVFRPLELSIYMPENQISPILPRFSAIDEVSFTPDNLNGLPYLPAALTRSRSDSPSSFSIPRKPLRPSSVTSSEVATNLRRRPDSWFAKELLAALEIELPKSPPPARLRAMTEPPSYERVKSALHEKFELERRLKDIEEVIEERRSVYLNSRPTSRATSSGQSSIYEESHEPMPPLKQSFAVRVALPHADQRPKTAPSKTIHIPTRAKSFTEASAAFNAPARREERALPPPPPPLPLILQAPQHPLRKKKSFSRVSNWLFPSEDSGRISVDSITNTPRPIKSREGFYQCVDLKQPAKMSTTSLSTVSTLESELDEPTVPTTWTAESSPGGTTSKDFTVRTMSMDSERNEKSIELTRVRTFGEKEMVVDETWRIAQMPGPGRNSVGVAF